MWRSLFVEAPGQLPILSIPKSGPDWRDGGGGYLLSSEELHSEQREDQDEQEEEEQQADDGTHTVEQGYNQIPEWRPVPAE